MSMDLFLEMARKQLDLLLNPTFLASEPVSAPRHLPLPVPSTLPSSSGKATSNTRHVLGDSSTNSVNADSQLEVHSEL